jgi:GNAT superfamily N-acetyltransferase
VSNETKITDLGVGIKVAEADEKDLDNLLLLYTQLHDNTVPEKSSYLFNLWQSIMNDPNHHIVVCKKDGKIVSSCVIVIIRNLTHNQRPYALIENVITDEQHREKGLATACLNYAKEIAQKESCYKIMLMTGSKQESTLRFYEKAGYNRHDKTAFIQWL